MNIIKFLLPIFLAVLVSCTSGNAEEEIRNNDTTINTGRTLIVYFSWSGNTRTVANIIHEITGSNIVEIEPEEPYPDVYNEVVARFQNERDNNILPSLRTQVENIDDYDTLIVGSPIWGGLLSPPVKSFLAGYDLSGKKILPFCTHGGSGTAQSVDNIREVCPDSEILQPLAVYGSRTENSRNEIEEWLATIGLIKD